MSKATALDAVRQIQDPGERAAALKEATAELPRDQQAVVATGIDKEAWPQNSRDRMLTILGSVGAALLAALIAILAYNYGAKELSGVVVGLATAIVGGIFGYAQQK